MATAGDSHLDEAADDEAEEGDPEAGACVDAAGDAGLSLDDGELGAGEYASCRRLCCADVGFEDEVPRTESRIDSTMGRL